MNPHESPVKRFFERVTAPTSVKVLCSWYLKGTDVVLQIASWSGKPWKAWGKKLEKPHERTKNLEPESHGKS